MDKPHANPLTCVAGPSFAAPAPQLIITEEDSESAESLEKKIGTSIPGTKEGPAVNGSITFGKLKLSGNTQMTLAYRFLTDEEPDTSFDLAFAALNRKLTLIERSTLLAGVSKKYAAEGFSRGTNSRSFSFNVNKKDNDLAFGIVNTADILFSSGLEFLLLDSGALYSAAVSGLPMAVIQRDAAFSTINSAMRDINGRLFRLRSRTSEADPSFSKDSKSVRADHKGKMVIPPTEDQAFRFELFASGDYGSVDRDTINSTPGLYSNSYSGTAGIEFHPSSSLTFGASITGVHNHLRLAQNIGSIDADGVLSSIYASWFHKNFYVDALYGVAWLEHDLSRDALFGNTARATPESWSQILQLNTGYNIDHRGLITGPFVSLNYVNGEIQGYNETDAGTANLWAKRQSFDSLSTQLGWQISYPIQTARTTITPQLRLAWGHEWRNDSEEVDAQLASSPFYVNRGNRWQSEGKADLSANYDRVDRDYLLIGAGIGAQLSPRISLRVDYEAHLLRAASFEQFASIHGSLSF